MYGIIYMYKQNLMNDLSKLQILASHATIGVPVSFLLSSFFLKNWFEIMAIYRVSQKV